MKNLSNFFLVLILMSIVLLGVGISASYADIGGEPEVSDTYVVGQLNVTYNPNGDEVYDSSNSAPKIAERQDFCNCVESMTSYPVDSCIPIHPVLPNLSQPIIDNKLLNEVTISFTPEIYVDEMMTALQTSLPCTGEFTVEYSEPNFIFRSGLPDSVTVSDPGGPSGPSGSAIDVIEPSRQSVVAMSGGPVTPNDTYFGDQWSLNNSTNTVADINAPEAWALPSGTGNDQTIIAVIDTGIDYNHPDLVGKMWDAPPGTKCIVVNPDHTQTILDGEPIHGCDFYKPDNDPIFHDRTIANPNDEGSAHGTEVAGVVAAAAKMNDEDPDPPLGIAGVCPECKIMALRAGGSSGGISSGNFTGDKVKQAIFFAIHNGADVINMSFFFNPSTESTIAPAKGEMTAAYNSGIVLVAAAGNDRSSAPAQLTRRRYPAAYGSPGRTDTFDVIAVAGTNRNNGKADGFTCASDGACSTCYGGEDTGGDRGFWIDISAPGKEILTTVPVDLSDEAGDRFFYDTDIDGNGTLDDYYAPGYFPTSGTSFSSALVSGVAALIVSKNPDWAGQHICLEPGGDFMDASKYNSSCQKKHDYVRDLMRKYASDLGGNLSGDRGMGRGLVNAQAAVENVESLPGDNPPPDYSGINPPVDQIVPIVGIPLQFVVIFTDTDPLTITPAIPLPDGATFNELGDNMFRWTPNDNQEGPHTVQFQANDGVNTPPTLSDPITLNVGTGNPPVWVGDTNNDGISDSGPATLDAYKKVLILPMFEDTDVGDTLTITVDQAGVGLVGVGDIDGDGDVDADDHEYYFDGEIFMWVAVDGFAPNDDFCHPLTGPDDYTVTFRAVDGAGASVTSPPIQIYIPHNCAPALDTANPAAFNNLGAPLEFSVHLGVPLQFTLTAQDPDTGDTLGYYPDPVIAGGDVPFLLYTGIPTGSTLNAQGSFSYTPFYLPAPCTSESCTQPLRIYVSDRGEMQFENFPDDMDLINGPQNPPERLMDHFDTTVTIYNHKPIITTPGSVEISTCNPQFQLTGSDPDGDSFYIFALNLPDGASYDSNTLTFSWPSPPLDGEEEATFQARDYFCTGGNAPGSCIDDPATPEHPLLKSWGNPTAEYQVTISVATCAAPSITTQPTSQTVTAGAMASFSVVASGTPAPTYQWQKNLVDISGATSASYTTPVTTTADSGSTYRCVVTNAAGSATSNAAILTVNSGGGGGGGKKIVRMT